MHLVKHSSVGLSPISRKPVRVVAKAVGKPSADNGGYRRKLVGKLLRMAVDKAKRVCENNKDTHACAIAWDLVEDYETTLRRMKQVLDDPMESYCREHPSDLECRVYDM